MKKPSSKNQKSIFNNNIQLIIKNSIETQAFLKKAEDTLQNSNYNIYLKNIGKF